MKNDFVRRTAAAAAAMLMALSIGACGRVENTETSPAGNTKDPVSDSAADRPDSTSSAAENDDGKITQAPVSAEPVSQTEFAKLSDGADSDYINAAADFSAELIKNTCADELREGKNVLVSPLSVLSALGMTANGAVGETSEQMQQVLCGGISTEEQNRSLNYILSRAKGSQELTFNAANSVWSRNDGVFEISQDFADTLRKYYDAESYQVDFNEDAVNDINAWVNNNTNGMIPEIINELDPLTVMVLVNAIAFEAEWAEDYTDDHVFENSIFTCQDGTEEDCTLLYSTEELYFDGNGAEGFVKFYKGYDYALMAILPEEGKDLPDFVEGLTGGQLTEYWNSRRSADVYAYIPEFAYDYSSSLSDPLKAMGMDIPFSAGAADFSLMGDTYDGEPLYISDVLHKTHIELDRKGTRAAAATAVIMDKCEAEMEEKESHTVRLDRPFVYAIVDTETGFPVFLGAVNTVSQN